MLISSKTKQPISISFFHQKKRNYYDNIKGNYKNYQPEILQH